MKINFLIFDIYGLGGTVRTVLNIANYLVEEGYKVEIISVFKHTKRPHFEIDSRIKVTVLIDKSNKKITGVKAFAKRAIMKAKSVLIHKDDEAYHVFNILSDIQIMRAVRSIKDGILVTTRPSFNILASKYVNKNVTVIAQEHLNITIYPEKLKNDIIASYGKLNYIATLTDDDTHDYRELLKDTKAKVVKLTNAVPKLEDGFIDLQNKTIIAAGRLVEQKGFDLLIDSFGILKDDFPDWRVKIFGQGRDKNDLQARILEKDLYNHVMLMGPTTNIEKEFRNSSIFALSSRYEGFGMVIVEAMQCGVPVVSFDCPRGPGEIINSGIDGILVENGNIEEFANELANLMNNYDERVRLSKNSLESVKKYSIDVIGKEWIKVLNEIEKNNLKS